METLSETTLLIRKQNSTLASDIKNLETYFGASLISMPMLEPTETKDTGSRDWADEHGIDVYNAGNVFFKDFDTEIEMGIMADNTRTCHQRFKTLLNYLTTGGTLHSIYSPWVQTGRRGARLKSVSDISFERENGMSFMTFKLKFNITDPNTEINENLAIIS